jgi:prepilin-type N-terminal cleavage/methylation domain-containing protein
MNLLCKKSQGFTLAELLIALGILGVIATFTIPKVLYSAQSGQNTAVAKEAASMVSGAYSSYSLQNGAFSTSTTAGVLTQYMNYVAVDSSTTYTGMTACSGTVFCLKLHNGGVLETKIADTYAATGTTNAIAFNLDPDGAGTATAVTFLLYYNGRLTTGGNAASGAGTTQSGLTTITTDPSYLTNWN